MRISLLVAPELPVSLAEAKQHCRVDHSDEDDYLNLLIGAGLSYAEHYCQRSFGEQTLQLTAANFPKFLPRPPLISVTEIRYWRDAEQITLDPSAYRLDLSNPGKVVAVNSFPTVDDRPDAVEITWVAGLPASENVRLACLIMVAHWYQVREPVVFGSMAQVPFSAHALLDRERWGDYA